ncbi:fumarylacetoacetate hydrolase family protein [Aspergillus fumigatus A1163]|uniref:Fumarylacetoacetate hydrolase family protein n=1 Tax=Aspergillus fumigatus (strain CBS 144.89 / FGSC A1163 / CEA10) TaxID=451804 RepID=B0YBE7_ASPFC|nr:fumarylacetoacetate hydrolase family protein [Aspergillus fumigatus A1163]KEY83582.1 fumarylacetoacetate hydrolase [Aspergillus fumigatus]
MAEFKYLIHFADENGDRFFADIDSTEPLTGAQINAYRSFEDLKERKNGVIRAITKLLPPVPVHDLPIYCVGLNYKSHAKEANGELCFVTSRECRDLSIEEAPSCILGYTIGNDLSCRFFQLPEQSGGQFFYAKAFDRFAPVGPVLVHPSVWHKAEKTARLVTRVNGHVKQDSHLSTDMINTPARILSWMSQGTTIPAYTIVMTGTPAGVGAFQTPRQFLKDKDSVDIEITGLGVLQNRVAFEEGQDNML